MRRFVFLAVASLLCALGVGAQQHNIDTQKSTLTIHVGKTGAFSGLGHEHEVRAPIHSGTAETGSHPAVEIHVDARELRVIDKEGSEKDRADVQNTMLGPEVLDSEHHQEIVFKSTGAEAAGEGHWTLSGNLTLRGQTRPISVDVTL
jgi:polyisoprenoid-binding protein YceI